MLPNTQYIIDEQGQSVVQIKETDWEKFVNEYERLKKLARFRKGLKAAFREVEQIRRGEVKSVTLKDFLDEL